MQHPPPIRRTRGRKCGQAMAPVIAHGVRGLRFSDARYKCGLVDAKPPRGGATSYFRGVTESEVRRSRKLNSFPLPVALPGRRTENAPFHSPFLFDRVCARATPRSNE